MDGWASDWPRCLLLLELATRYAESGRTHGCAKLKGRLEEWRRRMEDAPPPVHALLSELCYVCWLLGRGDLAMARHHAAEARRKAEDIGRLLRERRRQTVLRESSRLYRQSQQLRRESRGLREQSALLIAQAVLIRRQVASPEAASTQEKETADSELVLV